MHPPRNLLVLTNRGSRRAQPVRAALEEALSSRTDGPEVHWVDVFSTPENRDPVDRVAIVGGDGSVNLAIHWLDQARIDAPVAILPAGTGNNLARGLHIPTDAEASIRCALESTHCRSIDAVRYQLDRQRSGMMLQVAALGMPAAVARRFDQLRHMPMIRQPIRWLGDSFYRWLAIQSALRGRRQRTLWKLDIDGETLEQEGLAIFFGNEGTIGGGFHPCPRARLDDGLLDVCLIPPLSIGESFHLLPRVSRGSHLDDRPDIIYRQCRKLRIEQRPGPFLVDGDIVGNATSIELELVPGRLQVVLPAPDSSISTDEGRAV